MGEGGGHATGWAWFVEPDGPGAFGHAELGVGGVSSRVRGEPGGGDQDCQSGQSEDRGSNALAYGGPQWGGSLFRMDGLGGHKNWTNEGWSVELEDAFAVAIDVGDDGGEHKEEDAKEPDGRGV